MGVPTLILARTDAEAANLITSDHDANDKPFLTGERTQEGFYRVKNGLEQSISRGVAYAPYADLVWCETGVPDIGFAREFAQAVQAACPGKLLSYNCSPSFNWKKNLNDSQIAKFQEELSALGYKYQFITLAGIHINWFNTFQFAHAYARGEGMKHYTEMVQEPEFAAREKGYTFVSHQQEVGRWLLRRRHHRDPGRLLLGQGTSPVRPKKNSSTKNKLAGHPVCRCIDRRCLGVGLSVVQGPCPPSSLGGTTSHPLQLKPHPPLPLVLDSLVMGARIARR
jgi:isocitrate lyase